MRPAKRARSYTGGVQVDLLRLVVLGVLTKRKAKRKPLFFVTEVTVTRQVSAELGARWSAAWKGREMVTSR